MTRQDDELPEVQLMESASKIEDMRSSLLFSVEHHEVNGECEQLFLQSLAFLELAYRSMKLAAMAQERQNKIEPQA